MDMLIILTAVFAMCILIVCGATYWHYNTEQKPKKGKRKTWK